MSTDHIRYDILTQEAMRGVIRTALKDAATRGLLGDHHFYITFDTRAPDVKIAQRIRDEYPEEMTIVLQHQFWDLAVTDTGFEVGLSFSDVPEKLEVPFAAVRGFYDPSVNFELEFDVKSEPAVPVALDVPVEKKPEPAPTKVPAIGGKKAEARAKAEPAAKKPAVEAADNGQKGADVVSLDAFRKK